jgi:hypothetical protein
VLEVVTPAPQQHVDSLQQGGQVRVRLLAGQRPYPLFDAGQRLLRWIGIDVTPAGSSLAPPLDVVAQEVETLLQVHDRRLGWRQSQTHRGQDGGDLLPQRLGVGAGAGDHDDPIIRIADQPPVRQTLAPPSIPPVVVAHRLLPRLDEVVVESGQSDVGQQR